MNLNNKTILITGAAGFIGSNLVIRCLQDCEAVTIIGIDNMNDYYDVSINDYHLQKIEECVAQHPDSTWHFIKGNIADKATIDDCFAK